MLPEVAFVFISPLVPLRIEGTVTQASIRKTEAQVCS